MKKLCICISLMAVGLLFSLDHLSAAGGWKLIKNSNGIKVYERSIEGTELMEYMGVGAIDSKIEVIGEVLRDVPAYNKWLADCYGAQVEKKYDRNTMVIYMVLKPPIIEERDLVLKDKALYDWNNSKASISFTITDEVKIPQEKNRVRVTVMNGVFDMEYLGRDKTKFVYRLKVDPGGSIPKKVAYAVMKSYPYDTIMGLRKVSVNKKYADLAKGTDEERQIQTRIKDEGFVRKTITSRLSKFVKNKASFNAIVAADKENIKNIMNSGGSYSSVEKATTNFFIMYMEKVITDKKLQDKLRNDSKMISEITELIITDCGAYYNTIDNIVARYAKKYSD